MDPIGFKGKDFNLYGYAKDNPLKFIDQDGKKPGDCFIGSMKIFWDCMGNSLLPSDMIIVSGCTAVCMYFAKSNWKTCTEACVSLLGVANLAIILERVNECGDKRNQFLLDCKAKEIENECP